MGPEPSEQGAQREQSQEKQQDPWGGAARRAGPGTVVKVGPNAGGIRHHMGDVVLLMDAVKQVCHRALGKDRHVFPTVGLVAQGDSGLGLVVVVSCRSEISFLSACLNVSALREIPPFPHPQTGL